MIRRRYDTRTRKEILAASHFAAYRDVPRIEEIALRELRTLDAFVRFAADHRMTEPCTEDFLAFTQGDASPRRLDDLRTALDRLLPEGAPVRAAIRDAIRAKRPRSRTCDRRTRAAILADPRFVAFRDLPAMAEVALEDLRVLERFLVFAEERAVTVPDVADYLAFCSDVASSRRLRNLKAALDALLPGNPGVHIVLAAAIETKSPPRTSRTGERPRPAAVRRVPVSDLPAAWQNLLTRLRTSDNPNGGPAPAASVIASLEDVLREYAAAARAAGLPVEITIAGVRALEMAKTAHAQAREDPDYADQGNRPATRNTAIQRLRQMGEYLELDPLVIAALRAHEAACRQTLGSVVPLKFGRHDALPGLPEVWSIAHDLLAKGRVAHRHQTRLRLINESAVVALWTLVPLRLEDGRLTWGRDIAFDGARYRIDVETHKEGEPLQGRLHPAMTPFLDALVLAGMDLAHLEAMRARAMANELPLFAGQKGRRLAKGYPSCVWRAHFGTGAHIARTRVHSELGALGPEGVEAALALCAQRDARSRAFYQGEAVAIAQRKAAQDMIDALLEECELEAGAL